MPTELDNIETMMSVVWNAPPSLGLRDFGSRILAAARRGESEVALRELAAQFQRANYDRVNEADCQKIAAAILKVVAGVTPAPPQPR